MSCRQCGCGRNSRSARHARREGLSEAYMSGIGPAPVGSMAMKDVCNLQLRAAHDRRATPRVAASARSMMRAGRAGWLWPGSWYWRHGCKAPWCRLGMAQKCLNHANIDILLEEVGGEAV